MRIAEPGLPPEPPCLPDPCRFTPAGRRGDGKRLSPQSCPVLGPGASGGQRLLVQSHPELSQGSNLVPVQEPAAGQHLPGCSRPVSPSLRCPFCTSSSCLSERCCLFTYSVLSNFLFFMFQMAFSLNIKHIDFFLKFCYIFFFSICVCSWIVSIKNIYLALLCTLFRENNGLGGLVHAHYK